jgi:hypothetical protein
MRAAVAILAACGAALLAPVLFGGIVVTALAVTIAGASPSQSTSPCAGPTSGESRARVAMTIDAWIARRMPASPLRGLGAAMVAGASGSGLDPRLLAAIALQETSLGTAGGGPAVYNPFGLGPGLAFPSWEAAIALAVRTLASMHAAGAQTIAGIAMHWAPVGAANDPTGLNANWVGGVSAAYAAIGGNPAGPVFGRAARATCRPVGGATAP